MIRKQAHNGTSIANIFGFSLKSQNNITYKSMVNILSHFLYQEAAKDKEIQVVNLIENKNLVSFT